MYITKEQIVKQFDELIEQLDTINALGIARAAQNYAEETKENIVEHYRLDALELLEEILELDADVDLDNTELDSIDIFGDDDEGEE